MSKTIIGIQARLTSTRFPRKVFEEIAPGLTVLESCIQNCAETKLPIFLLTPDTPENDELATAYENDDRLTLYRGSEDDVLGRYLGMSAKNLGPDDYIVRITSDCPFPDPDIILPMAAMATGLKLDYLTNVEPRTFPTGLDVEVVRAGALLALGWLVKDEEEFREHVTLGFRGVFKDEFITANYHNPGDKWSADPKVYEADNAPRLCVDYPEDMDAVKQEYARRNPSDWGDVGIDQKMINEYWLPRWSWNTAANFHQIEERGGSELSLDEYVDKHSGEVAVLTGGGPSLNANIEKLLTVDRSKYKLLACTSTLNPLVRNGLIPDYTLCNDSQPWVAPLHFTFIDPDIRKQITLVASTTLHPKTFKSWPGPLALYSETHPFNPLMCHKGPLHSIYHGMTRIPNAACVTNLSVRIAALMGFRWMVLIGADLGMTDGKQRCVKYGRNEERGWYEMPSPVAFEKDEDGVWQPTEYGDHVMGKRTRTDVNGVPATGEYLFYQEDLLVICNMDLGTKKDKAGTAQMVPAYFDVINGTEGGTIAMLPTMPVDEAINKAVAGELGYD